MLTHPEKLLFPDDGITKGELFAYYESVSDIMLPHVRDRPVTMERYPKGIGEPGFMHKSVTRGFPPWLQRVTVPKQGGVVHYPLITNRESLLWMVNQNAITLHVWTSRVKDLFRPDLCVFDLDPLQDEPDVLRRMALALRDLLKELGLKSWVKATGSKGFHIAIPLDGSMTAGTVIAFADRVAQVMVRRYPEHLTLEFTKAERGGRILVDTGRNYPGATFAAVYSVRPRSGAPVSAPCAWSELESGAVGPRTLGLRAMPARIAAVGDLWAAMWDEPVSLSAALQQLEAGAV